MAFCKHTLLLYFLIHIVERKEIRRELSENVGVGSNAILSVVLFWSYDTYILAIPFIQNSSVLDIQIKCLSAWLVGRRPS